MASSTTYLLTVWRPAPGGFRADLRAVDEEAVVGFDSAPALLEHLLTATRRPFQGPPSLSAAEANDTRLGDAPNF